MNSQPPHPQYKVRWIVDSDCKSCGQHSKKQYTFAFFKPEPALDLAIYVLNHKHILLSVDQ